MQLLTKTTLVPPINNLEVQVVDNKLYASQCVNDAEITLF